MDIENQIYKEFKDFIQSKVDYETKILPRAPKNLIKFPTIIVKESSNVDYSQSKTLNGLEYADQLMYTIEIYTKDIVINNNLTPSRKMQQELKQLTFEFFRQCGFERMSCTPTEYLDITVDRLIIVEEAIINNWNNKLI